jgi:transaldolase
MKATARLRELGQNVWLDDITRRMLDSGQLHRYIKQFSVTGLTSNSTIFDKAIQSGAYDEEIHREATDAVDRERLFFDIALEDLRRAADLFAPVHRRTDGIDGWVSLEVSPLLAYDTARTVRAATHCTPAPGETTCSSKSPVRGKDCGQSKRRASPASR